MHCQMLNWLNVDKFIFCTRGRQIYPQEERPGTLDINANDVAVEFSIANDERTRYFY